MDTLERFRGALLGLAAGDAVGTTVEFEPRGTFSPVTDMVGGGPFALRPGQWTDDTSMALCLATSLVECRGFDARDQMRRYSDWRSRGYGHYRITKLAARLPGLRLVVPRRAETLAPASGHFASAAEFAGISGIPSVPAMVACARRPSSGPSVTGSNATVNVPIGWPSTRSIDQVLPTSTPSR